MANKYQLVQDDQLPEIYVSITDEVTGDAIDLSDPATVVRMALKEVGATELKETLQLAKLTGVVTVTDTRTGEQTISVAPPYDVAGAGGHFQHLWTASAELA